MKHTLLAIVTAATVVLSAASSQALLITASGTSVYSSTGTPPGIPVEFSANLSISDNILTLVLQNNSSSPSQAFNDTLSSFFFDIVYGTQRPTLTISSAIGDVYATHSGTTADTLSSPNKNLLATASNKGGWQYKPFVQPELFIPYAGKEYAFGIGTTGNNSVTPTSPSPGLSGFPGTFNGGITGNAENSIYAGEVTSNSLNNKEMVYHLATFTFTISSPGGHAFTDADIIPYAIFGLGSAPDSILIGHSSVPEPTTILLFSAGLLGLAGATRKRKK